MGLIDDLKKWAHPYEDEDEEYEDDFAELGKTDPMFKDLADIVAKTNGLWSLEAENYLLAHAKSI